MPSPTKQAVIQRHAQNELLTTPAPSLMMRDAQDLSADEALAPLDERIIASTVEALEAGQTHYAPVPGIDPLREAVAAHLNHTLGTGYQAANVLVTAGMQEARFLTTQMVGQQFGRIALPTVVHPGVRKALGVRPMPIDAIDVDTQGRMLPTPAAIRRVLEGGSRLLYLESPSRLTGAAYGAGDVAAITALVSEFEATVIWDQGLAAWVPPGDYISLATQEDSSTRVIAIGEAWPGMGLASWFVGYIAAPEDRIPPMQSQKQIMAICTSTPSQFAALEASRLFATAHPGHMQQLSRARASLLEQAASASLQPIDGAAVNVLALRPPPQDAEAVQTTLRQAGYTVAEGKDFGAPHILRLTVSTSQAATAALRQLA